MYEIAEKIGYEKIDETFDDFAKQLDITNKMKQRPANKNTFESNIGKTKILRFIQKISPRLADNILKNG